MRKEELIQLGVVGVLAVGLLMFIPRAWADDTAQLKDQVKALQERVDQLESELGNKQQGTMAQPAMPVSPVANGYYDQWDDPFRQMMQIQQQMDRNMRQAMAGAAMYSPRMDMKQTDNQYIITMDIPGMDKDKINVENKEGMLIISGERRSESQDNKNNQYYRQERSFGSFMQAIPLPDDAKTDKIEARYKDGVLTVTIARYKKEEKKSENGKITVN